MFNPIPDFVLQWMQGSVINSWMLGPAWSWVACETLHFIGMCMLFGPIIIMDLRIAGFDRRVVSAKAVHSLIPLSLAGFGINLVTGILFLFGDPYRYAINVAFQIKMVLIFLAGLNAIYFWRSASRLQNAVGENTEPSLRLRIVGLSSLSLWTGVLCLGRLIPYLGTG